MSKDGLAVASEETTKAPMFRDEEQDETVARGCVRVSEVIAYDFVKMETVMDSLTGQPTDMKRKIEKGRGPYFFQDSEDFLIFQENNPKARLETFNIQMRKSTAEKRINDPENVKQFARRVKQWKA
jgi:hypothetical protein